MNIIMTNKGSFAGSSKEAKISSDGGGMCTILSRKLRAQVQVQVYQYLYLYIKFLVHYCTSMYRKLVSSAYLLT